MSHELFRLAGKLFDSPQLCTPEVMSHAVEYVASRCQLGKQELALLDSPYKGERPSRVKYDEEKALGVFEFDGPITYVSNQSLSMGESLSHKMVQEEVTTLLEQGAKTIVLDQDSGGGEAYGTFETASLIRNLCDDYGAKLIAYVDGVSASASYAYSVVAHEVVMNPGARVGSIGVVLQLRNFNKRYRSMGVEDTYIYAGDSKIPFKADGEWDESFLEGLQEDVDMLYGEFTSHVAMWRGLDEKAVKDTQAKMFTKDKALELGLVDAVMTREEFKQSLNSSIKNEESNQNMLFNKEKEKTEMSEDKALSGQVEELTSALKAKDTELSEALSNVTALEEKLQEAIASIDELKTEMSNKQTQSRKEKMTAIIGSEKAEDLEDIYSELSDEKFDKFLGGFKTEAAKEEEDAMLNELGTEGEDVVTTSDKEEKKVLSAEERIAIKYSKENK